MWLPLFCSDGLAVLADRRSVRRHHRRTFNSQQLQKAVALSPAVASVPHLPVAGIFFLHRCQDLQSSWFGAAPQPGAQAACAALRVGEPGDLIHVDIKTLPRFQ